SEYEALFAIREQLNAGETVFDGVDSLQETMDLLRGFADDGQSLFEAAAQLDVARQLMQAVGLDAGKSVGALKDASLALSLVGAEQAQQIAAFSAQLTGLQDLYATDRIAAFEETQRSVWELWRAQGEAIVGVAEI